MTVSVTGGHYFRETVTDRHGRHELRGLPTGSALLVVAVGDGFYQPWLKLHLDLPDARSCSEQDFRLHHSSAAWGRLVDGIGRPVRSVAVYAFDAGLTEQWPPRSQVLAVSGVDGAFMFEDLPPGRYLFGVQLTHQDGTSSRGSPMYLPGTSQRRDAKVIELVAGDCTDVGTIRLRAQ